MRIHKTLLLILCAGVVLGTLYTTDRYFNSSRFNLDPAKSNGTVEFKGFRKSGVFSGEELQFLFERGIGIRSTTTK
jgi:hypothetical protein